MKHSFICFFRFFFLFLFLFLWELFADMEWIDAFIFSSPSRIFHTFYTMLADHSLVLHVGLTLFETILSFVFVILIGFLSATIFWLFPTVSDIFEPYLVVLNSLPKSALAPLLIVWLGANIRTIIVAGISVAIFGTILSFHSAFKETEPEKQMLIRTMGGNKKDILLKVLVPSNIPALFTIAKVDIGLCLVGVIIGEFIGAKNGLGYLIIYGSQVFRLDWVIMSISILCACAMLLYSSIQLLEKKYISTL